MKHIDVVFDGPPSHESGRFVEVEDETGRSVNVGEWIERGDGLWALRFAMPPAAVAEIPAATSIGGGVAGANSTTSLDVREATIEEIAATVAHWASREREGSRKQLLLLEASKGIRSLSSPQGTRGRDGEEVSAHTRPDRDAGQAVDRKGGA